MTYPSVLAKIDDNAVKDALKRSRGDIFSSAVTLGCTAMELDKIIRSSEELRMFISGITEIKRDNEYDRMSESQFSAELDRLTMAYRVEAIGIIHELATMDFDNAAMAEVKLKAAIQLRGGDISNHGIGEQSLIMQELNNLYQSSAPRIKSIRLAQIELHE